MYKFIRTHQKKLLAVFGVVLMVIFILPSPAKNPGMGDQVVGYVAGEKIFHQDVVEAQREWELLEKDLWTMGGPLAQTLGMDPSRGGRIHPAAWNQLDRHQDMYFLLRAEARKLKAGVSDDQLNRVLESLLIRAYNRRDRKAAFTSYADLQQTDPAFAQFVRTAVGNFLKVRLAFQQAASVVKVSQPLRQRAMAQALQKLQVNVVEFPAGEFRDKVAAPTKEQLRDQFIQFAAKSPEQSGSGNPFGFGYLVPNRVALQYIAVPRAEVRKVAQATRSDYAWEVEARKYYHQHQSEFPATQPDELSKSPFSLGPLSLAVKPPSGPTTRPFRDVRQQIIDRLLLPETDRLQTAVQQRILDRFRADYQAWLRTQPSAATPATQVSTTQPGSFASYDYLKKLAADIQRELGVFPATGDLPQLTDRAGLAEISGIGKSRFPDGPSFGDFAIGSAKALLPLNRRGEPEALDLLQPSPPLKDDAGSVYIFRLTAAEGSHLPADQALVAERVEADWRTAASFDLARQAARKLLDAAQSSSLASAAASAGRKFLTAGPFDQQTLSIPGYAVTGPAREQFVRECYKLLEEAARSGNPRPMAVVELPSDRRVVVVQLIDVLPAWTEQDLHNKVAQLDLVLSSPYWQQLELDWFNYKNLTQRVGYERTDRQRESEPSIPPPMPIGS